MNDIIEKLLSAAKDIGYGKVPKYEHCETYTIGAFDLILINKHGGDAFEVLEAICQKYNQVRNDNKYLSGYFVLLNQLVYLSKTTELPNGMEEIISENPSLSNELKKWYRIKG